MNDNHIKISQNIVKYRLASNISQKRLSQTLGISSKTLSAIECSRKKVSLSLLLKISEILQVSVDKLLEGVLLLQTNSIELTTEPIKKVNNKLATLNLRQKIAFYKAIEKYRKINRNHLN